MGLQSSGAISLNDIHIEAGGSSGTQASINDSDIRALISKSSGAQMSFNEWYGASAAITETISTTTTNLNVSTKFGSNFTAAVAKVLVINSGVQVGATSLSNYAIYVPSGMGGTLNIQNAGTLNGAGGDGSSSGNGGDGGTALYIASNNVTVTNTGIIRGGGGGGGRGANGSPGASSNVDGIFCCYGGSAGSGGAGGNGQGYDQSRTTGSGGGGGGAKYAYLCAGNGVGPSVIECNAQGIYSDGSGGSDGGNGGYYGQAGSQGGGGGSQGGAAGRYIQLASGISYSLSNSGSVQGTAP